MAERTRTADRPVRTGRVERYARIVEFLSKHGFAVLEDRISHGGPDDREVAAPLREALEELGTVFIKLGQFVWAQSASLPPAYRSELAKLDDEVPPSPTADIRAVIERNLEAPVDELFASFDDAPIGSASIGQVHSATLRDGREVVVKVKKPGVDDLVRTDLGILGTLVARLQPHWRLLRDLRADQLMPEFEHTLDAELDYASEAASTRTFGEHFAGDPGIEIPRIVDDLTRGDVICETRLSGTPIGKAVGSLDARARTELVDRIVVLLLEPGLTAGPFHADPHAGNLLVTGSGALGVLDFGKVGRLGKRDQRRLISMLAAVGMRDPDRLTTALLAVAGTSRPIAESRIAVGVDLLLQRYGNAAIGGIGFGKAAEELLELFRANGLTLPGRIVLFFKALAKGEGLIRDVDPDARFGDLLRPVLGRIAFEKVAGGDAAERLLSWAIGSGAALADLPVRLDRLLTTAADGDLRVWTRLDELPEVAARLEGMADRLAAAVLVAAAMIGGAVVLEAYRPPLPRGVGAVAWILLGILLSFVVRSASRRMRRG